MDQVYIPLLERLAATLSQAGVRYMVIGGQAVIQYGEARLTQDIDITLGIGVDSWRRADRLLRSAGLVPRVTDYEALAEAGHILLLADKASGIRIDAALSGSPLEEAALARVTYYSIGSTSVAFTSFEDLLIQKVFAGRERDHDDVKRLLRKRSKFDVAYVEQWLRNLGPAFDRDLLSEFRSFLPK
ncbi:MAG: hypothetical protein ACKVQQ_21185 [Burkholderiales bacterium]